jgi:predicted O-linked N-acetylglucosamine transferase (SPINDLY family)
LEQRFLIARAHSSYIKCPVASNYDNNDNNNINNNYDNHNNNDDNNNDNNDNHNKNNDDNSHIDKHNINNDNNNRIKRLNAYDEYDTIDNGVYIHNKRPKLKLGFASYDFNDHPTTHLVEVCIII